MAVYLIQSDLNERLQKAYICAGNLAYNTSKEYRYGIKCADKHLEDMFLLTVFIKILQCYIPITALTENDNLNCITEKQAIYLFEQISEICNMSFDTINTTY
tara:strand:+ start:187 stop:492 length:306 start_codon:yes stop_codon:yes gene_type:complete